MQKTVIKPGKKIFDWGFKELLQYRELIMTLMYRDLKVKYAQTIVGVLWAVINPVFTLLVLTFVFDKVAKVDVAGHPHILFTTAGMIGWTYFATVVSDVGSSIIGAQDVVKKVYFPRLIIPLSKSVGALVDLAMVMFILFGLMIYFGYGFELRILYLPVFILAIVIAGLAGGLWISALSIRFRDFQYITPFLLRLGMFVTPIAYSSSSAPADYQWLFNLNPLAGPIEGIRWSILGTDPPGLYTWISIGFLVIVFIGGLLFFNQIERKIADII